MEEDGAADTAEAEEAIEDDSEEPSDGIVTDAPEEAIDDTETALEEDSAAEVSEVTETDEGAEEAEEAEEAQELLTMMGAGQANVKLNKARLMTGQPIEIDTITAAGPFTYRWYVYEEDKGKGEPAAQTDKYTPSSADYGKWIEVDVYTESGAFVGMDRAFFASLPVVYIDSEDDQSSLSSDYEVPADMFIQGNNSHGCQYDGGIDLLVIDDNSTAAGTGGDPYRIKLSAAASLFGMSTASYYVLISEKEYDALPEMYTYPDGVTPVKMDISGEWTELVFNDNTCGKYRLCEYAAIAYFNSSTGYPNFPGSPTFNKVRSFWLYNTLFERNYTPGYYYLGANGEKIYIGFSQSGKTEESCLMQWACFPYFLIKSAEQYWLTRDEILNDYGVNNTTLYFGYGYPGTTNFGALKNRINVLDALFRSEEMILESFANAYEDMTYKTAGAVTISGGNLKDDTLTDKDRAPSNGLVPDNTPAVLELEIGNSQAASILVYINGEKYTGEKGDARYSVKDGKVSICIGSDALDADFGTKNIISFILMGKDGKYMKDAMGRVLTDYVSIIKTDAVSAESYTVSFETNGGSTITPQPVDEGQTVRKPVDPTKAGHVFIGWYEDAALTTEYSFSKPVMKDMIIYARWNKEEEIAGKRFTVTFDTNGGLAVSAVRVQGGELLERPADPVKNGYIFMGWYSDTELKEEYDFSSVVVKDFTLYARWKKDPAISGNTYTITFVSDCPTQIPAQSVKGGEYIEIPVTPVKEGYDFTGWYADAQKTVPFDFTIPVTSDMTIYAGWYLRTDAPVHTIRFVLWKFGGELPLQTVVNGQKVNRPVDPSRYGYRFEGWYTDEALTQLYDFNAPVYSDITLYAKWVRLSSSGVSSGGGGGGGGGGVISGGSAGPSGGISGTWNYDAATDTWTFTSGGKLYKDEWAEVSNGAGKGTSWFRFDKDGKMLTGWYADGQGRKFYLNPLSTGTRGAMLTGWQQIGGAWYYFNEKPGSDFGALVINGTAPDGTRTDANGRRIG